MLQPEIFDIDKPCYLQAKSLIKRCRDILGKSPDRIMSHDLINVNSLTDQLFLSNQTNLEK